MIEIKGVSYRYNENSPYALKDVSLSVNKGEMLCIVGHNGSGKSTLAKHLNGLILPSEGEILVDGMRTDDEASIYEIRRRVGMVFQNPDNQIVTTVVEEDVGFGPENLGVPSEEIIKRVEAALADVGMQKYARSAPHMLSGGQKQRVAMAGMLAMRPEALVLDEATSMLDPSGCNEVLSTVKKLNKAHGMTVIMITQHMEEALMCDRVAVMSNGNLVMLDTPKNVFKRVDGLRKIGLDVPFVVELRERLKAEGASITEDITEMDDMVNELCRLL